MTVDICIATYRRPQWLAQLLQDLAAQQLTGDTHLRVIVVDNDPACSAEAVIAGLPPGRLDRLYLAQPVKNIALTRNAALDCCRADFVAFVDDDESVPPHWLQTLIDCQKRFDADVVFGPVQGRLDASAPKWVRRSQLFEPERRQTGSTVQWGSTNNALLRGALVVAGARFDPQFGLTGGEDLHFFFGLSRRGAKLVWCSEALVSEHVPPARTTLRWVLQRHFRSGQGFADIVGRPDKPVARALWAADRGAKLLIAALMFCVCAPFGLSLAIGHVARIARNAGQLSTLLRYRLQEYR